MSDLDGAHRLRGAGVGSILGGLGVGAVALGVSYPLAAGVVLVAGLAALVVERKRNLDSRISLGVIAVGGIGLLEATDVTGVGIGPFLLAAFGIVFGLVDILLGSVLSRSGTAPDE